uniref:Secreted protein n=2 Tax=Anopheles christyi TaxID=43041 RepID=A0A182KI07_9DIPT
MFLYVFSVFSFSTTAQQKVAVCCSMLQRMLVVRRIKHLNTHKTVLTARRETFAIGMECHAVDWTEMSLNARKLLFVHQMEEAGIKLASLRRSRSDLHRILTTAKCDVFEKWANARRVDGPLSFERFQAHQRIGIKQLGRTILRRRDEHGTVARHLHIRDAGGVVVHRVEFFHCTQIPDT